MTAPYDLVIVGGGIAGLCAALAAPPDARIVVIDKGEAGAGSSPLAQGGLAAAVGPDDSVALHVADTVAAGAGICDVDIVEDICGEGPGAIAWLAAMGCVFDRSDDGAIHLAREGGQSVARSVHWRDATGAEIVRALRDAVAGRDVERARARALKLLCTPERCVGVRADRDYFARAVLVATGGAGGLWGRTTNAPGATADGVALAAEAGAQLSDLEFMQFHPTALKAEGGQRVLLTEALRGHGATLIDVRGERFVDELGPRHVVAKAIIDAGEAFLDCRHLADLEEAFPTVVAGARAHGFDPVTEPLPVEPAAHYFIGGISADAHGQTSLPGLFAAGECAATGMHGANRMAGNSLLETVVVGRRVGGAVAAQPEPDAGLSSSMWPVTLAHVTDVGGRDVSDRVQRAHVGDAAAELPSIMWAHVGPVRDGDGLQRALGRLNELPSSPHRDLCAMIARAAAARMESRGTHIRSDFPSADDAYRTRSFDRRRSIVRH